jgi:DNA mismatch repair protein MSH4
LLQLAAFETREVSTAKTAATRVAQMLNLRSVIRSLPLLQRATDSSRSQLLQFVHDVRSPSARSIDLRATMTTQMISDQRLAKMDRLVEEVLNEEAAASKVWFFSH